MEVCCQCQCLCHVAYKWLAESENINVKFIIGWVAVSANMGEFVTVRAYTPAGKGCCMRTPSLLPYAVLLKGKRISGTQGFECKRILATAQNDDENEQIDFRKMLIQNLQVKKGSIPVGKKYSKLEKNNVTWK